VGACIPAKRGMCTSRQGGGIHRAAEAGVAGTTAVAAAPELTGVVAVALGALGGAGRKSGPFWPQPASAAAAPTTMAARPCLETKARRRP